jgi:predicted Rossmann fold nucleotide-binding protein DprA/Smf involved in DNA uptake
MELDSVFDARLGFAPLRALAQAFRLAGFSLSCTDEPRHIDDIVEQSGLNSSEVLATLFDLEMKGLVRQSPGKLFSKVLL